MKYRLSVFWLFVLSPLFVFSQGPFSYDIELSHVNFQDGYPMRLDDNSGAYQNVNEYEQQSPGVYTTAPVAYMAGNSFAVEAIFQTSCPTSLFIRGEHVRPDGTVLIFPSHLITPDGSTGELHYTFDQPTDNGSVFSFPVGTVEFHDPFEILWQSSANEIDWRDIHTSANPVYVTKGPPNFPISMSIFDQFPYHTYFRNSCEAADGLSDNDDIIEAVWGVFDDLMSFKRADDNASLQYYGVWESAEVWANEMIPTADGQCSAYSMSFLNCLRAHGINQSNDYLRVEPIMPSSSAEFGLLINEFASTGSVPFDSWANNTPPSVPSGFDIDKVVIPLQDGNPYVFISSIFSDNVLYSEITDVDGVPGQSADNPKAAFANHQIIRLNVGGSTVYYDVPYGQTYSSLGQMKDNIYGYIYQINAAVDEADLGVNLNDNPALESSVVVKVWLIDTDPNTFVLDGIVHDQF